MAESTQERQIMRTPLFREVYKNTWLKLVTVGCKKKERLWVVFCVHDDNEAYLEAYTDSKLAILHNPCWFVSMNNVLHVTTTICPENQEYEFVITLQTDVIRLSASSWQLMVDWVETLKRKLSEMRVLLPKENVYSKPPETKNTSLLPTRDPTSPLPAPPPTPAVAIAGLERVQPSAMTSSVRPTLPPASSHYEPLFLQSSSAPVPRLPSQPGNKNSVLRRAHRSASNCERYRTPERPQASVSSQRPPAEATVNGSSPQRRRSSSLSEIQDTGCVTLRTQQVLQLEKEMRHPAGVRLELRRRDCLHGIAFVNVSGSVWIAGWKQTEHPMLYNCLHIGDQLLSVQGRPVNKASIVHDILKQYSSAALVELVIKRVPLGRVFAIRREADGQPLGILQQDGSAVIKQVLPEGLAARHGLPAKAPTSDGLSLTSWVLTEVNNRPLNLFFKGTEVCDRLNCVGRDISILVQPFDLVKQLKKQLKSLRNYKDYLLQ